MRPLFTLVLAGLVLVTACYSEAPVALSEKGELAIAPLSKPDRERGRVLFEENCAACHGQAGHGDGWRVPELSGPRPRDFHDATMMERMSPARAYLAVTRGVARTSMSAFDLLSASDRWHLAFYVLSLGQQQDAARQGEHVFADLDMVQPSPRALAQLSNHDILSDLNSREQHGNAAAQALAYLRRISPYEGVEAPLLQLREDVAEAINSYRKGQHAEAKATLQTAYLDELESQLKILRLRKSGLALATEIEMHALSGLLKNGAPVREIEERAQALGARLDEADTILSRELSSGVGAAQSASIVLSFGSDGALCLFLLLVLGTRRGADKRERKSVGFGLLIGLLLAVVVWLGWTNIGGMFPGTLRVTLTLIVSGAVALLSIPLLVGAIRHLRWPPQTRVTAAPSWLALLFLLSGGVVIRDALEIVPAMTIIARYSPAALLGFVGSGVLLIALVSLLVAMERNLSLNARTALIAMSITAVAVMASGSAARAAQDLGLLRATIAGEAQSPWLSAWPTSQGILLQLIFATACVVVLMTLTLLRQDRE